MEIGQYGRETTDERDGFGAASPPSLLRPLQSLAGRGVGVINPWKDPTVGVALSAETEIQTVGFHEAHSDSDSGCRRVGPVPSATGTLVIGPRGDALLHGLFSIYTPFHSTIFICIYTHLLNSPNYFSYVPLTRLVFACRIILISVYISMLLSYVYNLLQIASIYSYTSLKFTSTADQFPRSSPTVRCRQFGEDTERLRKCKRKG